MTARLENETLENIKRIIQGMHELDLEMRKIITPFIDEDCNPVEFIDCSYSESIIRFCEATTGMGYDLMTCPRMIKYIDWVMKERENALRDIGGTS